MSDYVGKIISHYRIYELIGRGGMGVVYKAEDTKLNRTVALKFLPPALSFDDDAKKRFIQEAQAASALDHNNICVVHEVDQTDDGQLFICMNFYEGETLKQKIERKPLNVDEVIDIIMQIAEGLQKAHEKGIIHRDIKPANIFITSDGVVKILDFGLAKLSGQSMLTKIGSTVGTVAYRSPEQTIGADVDIRTDIWSLGVVFYEMLTTQIPFKGDYEQAIIYAIMNGEYESVKALRSDVSPGLENIIKRTLHKEPELRYKDLSEFINDMDLLKAGNEIKLPKKNTSKLLVYLTSISVMVFALIMVIFFQKETIPFSYRDRILIADFENQTGEQVLDKSLHAAFILSIEQSLYVNVVSRRKMLENLKRMEKADLEFLDEETIRDMAIREGINIYLVPGISRIGNKYIISCKINESKNGETLKSEILYTENENELLEKLDILSRNIRDDLGETDREISKQGKPLRKVTTSSLEALKQYSLGVEEHWKSNFEQARYYYENSLRIDPDFISAKASLGNLLFEKFDREKGKILLAEAIESTDRVTEKEKYGILAFYSLNVERNLGKAAEYTKMIAELYPDDATPHNNLGWIYQSMGNYNDAVAEYKLALEMDPNLLLTYGGIIWIYLEHLGESDSAFTWTKKLLLRDNKNPWAYFYLGSVYAVKDSLVQAEIAFKTAMEISPAFLMNLYQLAHVFRVTGEYQKAIEILQKILAVDKSENLAHYYLGINCKSVGDTRKAIEHLNFYKEAVSQLIVKDPKYSEWYFDMSFVLARLENFSESWEVGNRAFHYDSTSYLPMAELMSLHNKNNEGIKYLEKAINAGFLNYLWLKLNPNLESLRDEPRFKDLITQAD